MHPSKFIFFLIVLLFAACGADDAPRIDTTLPYHFQDGFETSQNELDQLFPSDGSRWTGIQQVNPNQGENSIALNQSTFTEGSNALHLVAHPADAILSKMDIEKAGFFAPLGSTIRIEADVYLKADGSLQDLFLLDVECCSCWDNSVPDNQCPGIRLKLSDEEGYLSIERGKILGQTITQTEFAFPTEEWVNLVWIMKLFPDNSGENTLIVNGQTLIDELGKNLPNSEEFRNEFAMHGIDFELQEPHGYERLQIGATANASPQRVEMFMDNFRLDVE